MKNFSFPTLNAIETIKKKQTKTFRDFRVFDFTQDQKLGYLGKFFFTSKFERSCNLVAKTTKNVMRQKLKDQDMFCSEKGKISEVSEFSILPYAQNRKLGNLGKCSFTSNFDSSCNLRFRNDKNELRQKLKGQDMLLEEKKKISEISEFSILSYTQNRKLGNLGKCCFTSNFDSSCNLRCKINKKLTETKT